MRQNIFMVHPCGTFMTMLVNSYVLFGILQNSDYMILPRSAHTMHIASVPHVNRNLKCRLAHFIYKAMNFQNERIAFLAKLCMYSTMSITGSYVSNMLCEYKLNMIL